MVPVAIAYASVVAAGFTINTGCWGSRLLWPGT